MSSLNNSVTPGLVITDAEGNQIENIDGVTVSNTQWGYLGSMDQGVSTSDSVVFSGVTVNNGSLSVKAQAAQLRIYDSDNTVDVDDYWYFQNANNSFGLFFADASASSFTKVLDADTSGRVTVPNGSLTLSGGNLVVDANNISTDTTTGTKIGTSTSQKFGFFNATPVAQQTAAGTLTDNSGGSVDGTVAAVSGSGDDTTINNNLADIIDRINSLENTVTNVGLQA